MKGRGEISRREMLESALAVGAVAPQLAHAFSRAAEPWRVG
ncbi:MAG: hypothetical protein H6Q06_1402, partial [Acidobacteria bacterium]|nr:hypothetical protein [Acidobacteriota bacterium]